jgi:hypothetical protein
MRVRFLFTSKIMLLIRGWKGLPVTIKYEYIMSTLTLVMSCVFLNLLFFKMSWFCSVFLIVIFENVFQSFCLQVSYLGHFSSPKCISFLFVVLFR